MNGKERIAQRAYWIWEQEGRPHGRDLDHWLSACAEIEGKTPPPDGSAPQSTPSRTKSRKASDAA